MMKTKMSAAAVVLCAGLWLGGAAHGDYLAYAVGEQSKLPLPESIDHIEARYLVNLEWGDYGGGRSRVAVLPVDNTSSARNDAQLVAHRDHAAPQVDPYAAVCDGLTVGRCNIAVRGCGEIK